MGIDTSAVEFEKEKKQKQEKKNGGFYGNLVSSAKAKLKEDFDFRKKVSKTRKESFRKEKLVQARREGKVKATRVPFGGFQLGQQLQRGKEVGTMEKKKSNMERMMGL